MTNDSKPQPSETIKQWRGTECMTKWKFHDFERRGLGPYMLKDRGFVRVIESHESWRERMREHSQKEAARLEQARRIEQAKRAGQAAAKSPRHVSKRKPAAPLRGSLPRFRPSND
jgi:hypothetical protein